MCRLRGHASRSGGYACGWGGQASQCMSASIGPNWTENNVCDPDWTVLHFEFNCFKYLGKQESTSQKHAQAAASDKWYYTEIGEKESITL